MSQFKRPTGTLFQHLTYDNYYLKLQISDLTRTNHTLEANITELNRFIMSHYDLSFNVIDGLRIMTFDGSGNVLGCIHSDSSGNFVACTDLSNGFLPCVINPMMVNRVSRTSMCDASRCFPYDDYPYYRYPYYGYPYYGYPYYAGLYGDDYFYRDMSGVKIPNMRPNPALINGPNGTHIHIHPK